MSTPINTYQAYDRHAWARQLAVNLPEHIRSLEEPVLRNFAFGALLDSNGLVSFNHGGNGFHRTIQYDLHDAHAYTGFGGGRTFTAKNLYQKAQWEYGGYEVRDMIYTREVEANKGEAALVGVFDSFGKKLEESLKQRIAGQYWINRNAAGNEEFWDGMDTMAAIDGTINIATGAQRSANAADRAGYPDGVYAGIDTELGAYNGANEAGAIWPNGIADPNYDFWSMLVANATSTDYGNAGNSDFRHQGDEVLRWAHTHTMRNGGIDGQLTNGFLSRDYWIDFKNLQGVKEQIQVLGGGETPLRALGFKNVIVFDGLEYTVENSLPMSTGFGMNIMDVELRCMLESMFRLDGPEYDIDDDGFKVALKHLGNLMFRSPRNAFKVMNIA